MRIRTPRRRAAVLVETAVILTVFLLLLLMIIVGALMVFRAEQVSALAREGARYASVHGGQYQQETGNSAIASSDIYNAIVPLSAGLNLQSSNVAVSLKTYKVNSDGTTTAVTKTWDAADPNGYPYNNYPYVVTGNNGSQTTASVVVTVTYPFAPEILGGSLTFTGTSEIPMSY
ncbi:MAG TPA: TadE family protein [Gemmataceae bacterium]|nr:TadE family protein [Gemmataceae bacterium]